jgi:hypothetical protein
MGFPELLRTVIARLKLPAVDVAEDARNLELALTSGQTISLSLLDGDAEFAVSGLVCFYPEPSKQGHLFEALLAAHAFGYGTEGAVFGVDMETSKIFLFRCFPLQGLDLDGFFVALNRFVGAHRLWLEANQTGKLAALVDGPWPPVAPA